MDSGNTTQPASGEPEWLAARPGLRDGLIFAPRPVAGRPGYVIEDPGRGKFFRLGVAEYALVASLDGQTSVATAIERARHLDPQGRFGQQEALVLCNWLATEQLLEPVGESAAGQLRKLADRHQRQQRASWQNPLMMRIPLLSPERLVTRLVPWLGWIGSRWTLMATALLVLIALAQLVISWPQFTRSLTGVFSAGGQMQLLLVWLGLKIAHEVAHAVVCKRYGAEVREAGVLLLLFMPNHVAEMEFGTR